MNEDRVPSFCRVCGTRLVPDNTTVGFDPFTGEQELSQRLRCPNPTTNTPNKLIGNAKTTYTYHPSWTRIEGVWSQ